MSSGAEAADQVVNMSLRGIEVMAKISGEGAKHLAAYLFAALQAEADEGQHPSGKLASQRQGIESICRQKRRLAHVLQGGQTLRRPVLCPAGQKECRWVMRRDGTGRGRVQNQSHCRALQTGDRGYGQH